jgi:DNA-binding NarL/FixJ family response regulator
MVAMSAGATSVRVLVVDDSLPFRDGAHVLIDGTSGFEWIGEATCGEEAIETAARLHPDLVLMDVRMPGIGGIEAARRIAAQASGTVVVLMSAQEALSYAGPSSRDQIVPKARLNPTALKRLWEDRARALT